MTANYYTTFTSSVFSDNNTFWNDTEPTTSVISIGTNNRVNGSSKNHVCYAWHSVEGYSSFGTFEGNGNADGPFIYTGFRPALFFVKPDSANPWRVFDDKRNGFKVRGSNNATNQNGTTFVYGAWGSVPFKYNNTF